MSEYCLAKFPDVDVEKYQMKTFQLWNKELYRKEYFRKKTCCWTEEIFNTNKQWQGIARSTCTYIDLTQITTVTQFFNDSSNNRGDGVICKVLLYIAQRTQSGNIWYWYKPCLDW